MFIRLPARRHGWMALSSGSSAFGTTRCSSKIIFWPRPWQTGQAPAGALKEKCFGVGGSKLLPVAGEHILFECSVSIQSFDGDDVPLAPPGGERVAAGRVRGLFPAFELSADSPTLDFGL